MSLTDDGGSFNASLYSDNGSNAKVVEAHLFEAWHQDPERKYVNDLQQCFDALHLNEYKPLLQAVNSARSNCTHYDVQRHLHTAAVELRRHPWIAPPSHGAGRTFVSMIPERMQLDAKSGWNNWKFAGTDNTVLKIAENWPREQIVFDNGAETLYDYLLLSDKQQELNLVNSARWAELKEVPAHSYDMRPEKLLSAYQQLALCNAMNASGFGLFMDMGTGKTPIVIGRVCNEAKLTDHVYRCIIVCPNNVRFNWEVEFEQFATVPGKVTVIRGDALSRRKCLIDAFTFEGHEKYTCIVIGYDSLSSVWGDIKAIPWDLAVGDESHYFKTPTTRRFEYMMKVRDNAKARMPLTGTPITNNHLDLFAHFEFMAPGMSGFLNYKNFKSHYGNYVRGEDGRDKLDSIRNLPEMKTRLARNSFQITLKEAVPDLPEKVYDVYEVEMTPAQTEVYKEVRTKLFYEIENDMRSNMPRAMIVQNVLTKLLRLAQITSGFVVFDKVVDDEGTVLRPRDEHDIEGGNPKIEALLDIAKDKTEHDKTIVWATFTHDVRGISKALKDNGYDCVEYYGATSEQDRKIAEHRYNCDPACGWLVGNPAAGGTGINLLGYDHRNETDNPLAQETNTTHEVYYSENWSPVERGQSEGRGYRRGSRVHVRITDLCVPGTIDEEIRARVLGKIINALETSDVSNILKSVLGLDI